MIDLARVGEVLGPVEVRWTSADAMLYALALGIGSTDPTAGLQYTTENSIGIDQEVLGGYAIVLAQNAGLSRNLGDIDPSRVLHAGQRLRLHRALCTDGLVKVSQQTSAIYDKGDGALAVIDSVGVDADSDEVVFTSTNFSYIRGAGGFGGERGPSTKVQVPSREPDVAVVVPTMPNQSLVYRLCGDRNPLHSDPIFANKAGFARPIQHGLLSLGIALTVVAGNLEVPLTFESYDLSARFTRPVFPGRSLSIKAGAMVRACSLLYRATWALLSSIKD